MTTQNNNISIAPTANLLSAWNYMQAEFNLIMDDPTKTVILNMGVLSAYYNKMNSFLQNVQEPAKKYFLGVAESINQPRIDGVLHVWVKNKLADIELDLEYGQFTERAFRRIASLTTISKIAGIMLSQLRSRPDQIMSREIVNGNFFTTNKIKLIDGCINMINNLRNGNTESTVLIKHMLNLLLTSTDTLPPTTIKETLDDGNIRLIQLTDAQIIVRQYIETMNLHYEPTVMRMLENPDHHAMYMRWAISMYNKESQYANSFFLIDRNGVQDATFVTEIKRAFNLTVISGSVKHLLDGSAHRLKLLCKYYEIDAENQDLKSLYKFINEGDVYSTIRNMPHLISEFCDVFSENLTNIIEAYKISTESKRHITFSNDVCQIFAKFNSIIKTCFEQFSEFYVALNKAGKQLLRKSTAEASNAKFSLEMCLNADVDSTITGKFDELAVYERFETISSVYSKLIDAKDSFDSNYITLLDDRLLSIKNNAKRMIYEKKFLEILRKNDNTYNKSAAIKRLDAIEASTVLVNKYGLQTGELDPKTGNLDPANGILNPKIISSQTFSTLVAPQFGSKFAMPDGDIKRYLDNIQTKFLKNEVNATFNWLHFKGVAKLKYMHTDLETGKCKVITYIMTMAQAIIFLYIQDQTIANETVTWTSLLPLFGSDAIAANTALKDNLGDLMNVKKYSAEKKNIPLIKPSNIKFDHTTILTISNILPHTLPEINYAYKSKSIDNENMNAARISKIKVCIIRFMKSVQRSEFSTIVEHVINQSPKLRMPEPSSAQIKKVLDMLMNDAEQYIVRDEVDNRVFVYLA